MFLLLYLVENMKNVRINTLVWTQNSKCETSLSKCWGIWHQKKNFNREMRFSAYG